MSPDEFQRRLIKLAADGNDVAVVVSNILRQKYSSDRDGYKQAVMDGSKAVEDLIEAHRRSMPLRRDTLPSNYSPLLDQAGVVGQIWPGEYYGYRNRPGPLSSMLVLGTLGGLAGNTIGRGLGKLTANPKMKNWGTAAGAGLGLIPGIVMMAANSHADKDLINGGVMSLPSNKLGFERVKKSQIIPVEKMKDYVWSDPSLPPSLAAATTAIVEGANRMSPERRDLPFVTPSDVGRMAVGLGSGYASGLVVGKLLGGLFGVSDRSQQVLRQSGAAAGLLKAVVPTIL